jgi:hypothetical protein
MRPDQAELDATISRMEARHAEADLFPVYLELVMLIKYAEERR